MVSEVSLRIVRDRLLKLHKTLLDAERANYEREHGPVRTSGDMLQLVLGHGHFAWLRPYSQLIVRIDEWLSADERPDTKADALLSEADRLTAPVAAPEDSPDGRYRLLVDSVPEAALAHVATRQAITDAR